MGSEGYLINQFLCKRTNMRYDEWGGSYKKRMRFPVEIVKAVRKAVGEKFIIIFRLSMLDLVEQGSTFDDVIELAKALEEAGVTIINTGIGWHEARIPTIATQVPRGAFTWVTEKSNLTFRFLLLLVTELIPLTKLNVFSLLDTLIWYQWRDLS